MDRFGRLGKLPILGRLVPQIISPIHAAPSSTYLIGSGGKIMGCHGHERHQQSPANQHKVRGLLIPLTRNFSIESRVIPSR